MRLVKIQIINTNLCKATLQFLHTAILWQKLSDPNWSMISGNQGKFASGFKLVSHKLVICKCSKILMKSLQRKQFFVKSGQYFGALH